MLKIQLCNRNQSITLYYIFTYKTVISNFKTFKITFKTLENIVDPNLNTMCECYNKCINRAVVIVIIIIIVFLIFYRTTVKLQY